MLIANTYKITKFGKEMIIRIKSETGFLPGQQAYIEKIKDGKIIVTEKSIFEAEND